MARRYAGKVVVVLVAAAVLLAGYALKNGQSDAGSTREVSGVSVSAPGPGATSAISAQPEAASSAMLAPAPQPSFKDLLFKAQSGDPVGQRMLAERYEDCGPYSLSPSRHKATVVQLAAMRKLDAVAVDRILLRLDQLCADANNGIPIKRESSPEWLEKASEGGDLVATVRLADRSAEQVPADLVTGMLDESLRTGNADALLELSTLLGAVSKDEFGPDFAPYVGHPADGFAWAVAACRLGASCGPSSRLAMLTCITSFYCEHRTYDAFLLYEFMPPGQRTRVDEIVALLRARGYGRG